ncbi:hypothetical protein CapIbe_022069 [Capra ibex]
MVLEACFSDLKRLDLGHDPVEHKSKPAALRVPRPCRRPSPAAGSSEAGPPAQRSRERDPAADARPTATRGTREPGSGGGLPPLASGRRPRARPGTRTTRRGGQLPTLRACDASPGGTCLGFNLGIL